MFMYTQTRMLKEVLHKKLSLQLKTLTPQTCWQVSLILCLPCGKADPTQYSPQNSDVNFSCIWRFSHATVKQIHLGKCILLIQFMRPRLINRSTVYDKHVTKNILYVDNSCRRINIFCIFKSFHKSFWSFLAFAIKEHRFLWFKL